MSQANRCPECGTELPAGSLDGLCPKCLLAAGLESRDDAVRPAGSGSGAPTTPHSGSFIAPEPASLAAHFPQLEILELLGQGGMGAVYKARQPRLDRFVALKIIRPESADTPAFAERFNREARMLARLSHPQIVAVYDFGEVSVSDAASGQPRPLYFFIMEYVDGPNLRELMRTGEFTPQQALAIVPQVCEALQFAHDEGVVHRDIKPENILLDKRGRVKIADFGLAKLASRSTDEFTLTGTHQVIGTPRYMAPEQMEGSHAVDHRADIYSLGVVFYEMLTGEVPLGHFEPPSKKVVVDVRLDEVVLRALAREPERRYQHASDVKTDVESISTIPPAQRRDVLRSASFTDDEQIGAARQHVQLPAIGLIVIGALSLALGILVALMMSTWALGRDGSGGTQFLLALPAILIFTALPTAMIVGGVKMLRLTSRPWAVRASALAVSPIPAGPLWLVSLPLGIWSLVVLAKPEVKLGFARRSPPATLHEPTEPDAARRVQNPAWGLIITGIISWITIPMAFWIPIVRNLDATQRTIFQVSFGVIPLVVGTTVAVAGFRMRQLEGYRLAMFAAVLPIVVLLFKLIGVSFETLAINPADLVGAPMGLWALVVLSRKDVKAAFLQEPKADRINGDSLAPRSEMPSETLRPPFGFAFAVLGLLGLGWVLVGAVRHLGMIGFAVGILTMAAIVYGVTRWKLRYLPQLGGEISRQSPLRRQIAAVVGLLLFVVAMLAANEFVADAWDGFYFARNGDDIPGAIHRFQLSSATPEEQLVKMPDPDVEELDLQARLHRRDPIAWYWMRGGVYAAAAAVLFFGSVAVVLGTRRFQYSWSQHLRPALYVASLLVMMMPAVVVVNFAVGQMDGWGIMPPTVVHSSATMEEVAKSVVTWARRNGYVGHFNPTPQGSKGPVSYRSWNVEARSALDRCQFVWGNIVRPRPPMVITYLNLDGNGDQKATYPTIVLAELPFASAEERLSWQRLTKSLETAIVGAGRADRAAKRR